MGRFVRSLGVDDATVERWKADGLVERYDRLRDAIRAHREAIESAGTVRVDSRDEDIAKAKHEADKRLWAALDE